MSKKTGTAQFCYVLLCLAAHIFVSGTVFSQQVPEHFRVTNVPMPGALNIRERPDAESAMLTSVQGDSTEKIKNLGCKDVRTDLGPRVWCEVEYNGVRGWANASFLKPAEPVAQAFTDDKKVAWSHNGSQVTVSVSGQKVEIHYLKPRPGMLAAGAQPGSLLFHGEVRGSDISGTALIFNASCGTFPYEVSGHATKDLNRIELFGRAPQIRSATCSVVGHRDDQLVFQNENAQPTESDVKERSVATRTLPGTSADEALNRPTAVETAERLLDTNVLIGALVILGVLFAVYVLRQIGSWNLLGWIGAAIGVFASVATIATWYSIEPPFKKTTENSIRVTYYRLSGAAPALLVNGLVSDSWAEALGKDSLILNNFVLRDVSELIEKISTERTGDLAYVVGGASTDDSEEAFFRSLYPAQKKIYRSKIVQDRLGGILGGFAFPDFEATRIFLGTEDNPPGYNVFHYGQPDTRPVLWKYIADKDITNYQNMQSEYLDKIKTAHNLEGSASASEKFGIEPEFVEKMRVERNEWLQGIKWLTRMGIPKGFLVAVGERGDHDNGWSIGVEMPKLELEVAVIENAGQKTRKFEKIGFLAWGDGKLRTSVDTDKFIGGSDLQTLPLAAASILEPGKKIIVPLRITFVGPVGLKDMVEQSAPHSYKKLEDGKYLVPLFLDGRNEYGFQKKNKPSMDSVSVPTVGGRFDYGAAWRVVKLYSDIGEIPLRSSDWKNLVFVFGHFGASCPFVFIRDSIDGNWKNLGPVLVGAAGSGMARTDKIPLPNFDSLVEIRELEDEVSYIEEVKLQVKNADGKEVVLFPDKKILSRVVLGKGERLKLTFSGFDKAKHNNAVLEVKGFYEDMSSINKTLVK